MRSRGRGLGYAVAVVALLTFFLGPFVWQVLTSLWPDDQLGRALPRSLTVGAYASVLGGRPFVRWIANSLAVAAATTALCLLIGTAAGFALAKLEFRGRRLLLGAALAISMFPPIATVSPLYLALRAVGLRDQLAGLVPPYATFALPMTLWILSSFFRQLPDELYQAARVDGCTPLLAFRKVLLPLAAPGLFTTAILVFIFSWNEFLYARLLTTSQNTLPLQVFQAIDRGTRQQMAAVAIVLVLPILGVVAVLQRRLRPGALAGAIRG